MVAPKPPPAKAKPGTAKPAAATKAAPAPVKTKTSLLGFLAADPIRIDNVPDEAIEYARRSKLLRRIHRQNVIIASLVGVMIIGEPFFQPIYQYFALNPQAEVMQLVGLNMPNMTNHAVLSWATTSITEIMTLGFGDFEPKLLAQRVRFTNDGWEAFVKAFLKQKIGESFRKNQLVLTTVPSNTPVITSQGEDEHHVYQWHVEMPVIMTYATNNNVTSREHTIINLTIKRVPSSQSPAGIAIERWALGSDKN